MLLKLLLKHKNCKRTAIIEDDKSVSYKQLYENSFHLKNIISTTLSQQHLQTTSKYVVGIFLPNSINFVISFLAIMLAGKIISPLNNNLTKQETLNLIKESDITLLLTTTNKKSFFEDIAKCLPGNILKVIYIDEIVFDTPPNANITKHNNKNLKTNKNNVFLLLPTSGTTGNAKIVALSQKNVYTSVSGYNKKLNHKKHHHINNRLLILTPYFSSYGIMMVLWSLITQTLFVVYNKKFCINAVCELIETHRITSYEGGTLFLLWLEKTKTEKIPYNISTLNYIAFGGNKVHADILKCIMKNHPLIEISQGYGMTETSPLITKVNLSKKDKKLYFKEKQESVGTAIAGIKIYIRSGNKLIKSPNIIGEIVVKGKNVMLGYYKNSAETNKIKIKGKIFTGDIGYLDKQGYLYIIGREKNVIIVGGLNVYPEEIEHILEKCEYIKECKVYAENALHKSEIVCVDIVLNEKTTELKTIQNYIVKNLASYKQPKKINIVSEIVKSTTGKKKR